MARGKAAELGRLEMVELLFSNIQCNQLNNLEKAALVAEFSGHADVCAKIFELGVLRTDSFGKYCSHFKKDAPEDGVKFLARFIKRLNIIDKVDILLLTEAYPAVFKLLLSRPEFGPDMIDMRKLQKIVSKYKMNELSKNMIKERFFKE